MRLWILKRRIWRKTVSIACGPVYWLHRLVITPIRILKRRTWRGRKLDIGPGDTRIPGFETMDICFGEGVDYVHDVTKRLPFCDGTFDVVHSSHMLEHLPWYQTASVIQEMVRVVASNGVLEIWVPDAYKISRLLVDVEEGIPRTEYQDGWRVKNPEGCPYLWVNGRLLYGARSDYPSWHRSLITPRHLMHMMEDAGLVDIHPLKEKDVRSVSHGWINLGMRGSKP